MRYGFKTAPMNTNWTAMLDAWRVGDQLDVFESAWNFDHFEPIFSDRSGPCFEGWSMLAAMAQATSRLRLGCQVTGMPYRHPSVLANIAATVDIISGGRLIVGLGAGWNQEESDALGIRLPPLKERMDPRIGRPSLASTSFCAMRGASPSRYSVRTRPSRLVATGSGVRCASSRSTRSTGTQRLPIRRSGAGSAMCSRSTAPPSVATRPRSSGPSMSA
jgi:Luciferase-like monooxygenase